jgi:hypothetical protein
MKVHSLTVRAIVFAPLIMQKGQKEGLRAF